MLHIMLLLAARRRGRRTLREGTPRALRDPPDERARSCGEGAVAGKLAGAAPAAAELLGFFFGLVERGCVAGCVGWAAAVGRRARRRGEARGFGFGFSVFGDSGGSKGSVFFDVAAAAAAAS